MGKLGKKKREERTLAKLRTAYERKVRPLKRKLARRASDGNAAIGSKIYRINMIETEIYRANLAYMIVSAQIKLRGFLKAPAAAFARQAATLQSTVPRIVKRAREEREGMGAFIVRPPEPGKADPVVERLLRITPEDRARLEEASARVRAYIPPIAADLGVPLQAFRDVTLRDVMKDPEDPRRNPYPLGTHAHAAFKRGREEGAAK